MTTPPVSGPDALALRRLRQVVAMGEREGSYTSADCVRLAEAFLPNPHTLRRAYLNERVRADRLAEEVAELRGWKSAVERLKARDVFERLGLAEPKTGRRAS